MTIITATGRAGPDRHLVSELTHTLLCAHPDAVLKSLIRSLLFAGVLLGLAGNSVAAAVACNSMALDSATGMSAMADCADMTASSTGSQPDKGIKPGCMIMAGCVAMLAFKEPVAVSATRHLVPASPFPPAPIGVAGREFAPEPEPPTLLG